MDLIKATLQVLGEAPEDKEPASPDELSMALKQLSFIEYAAKELEEYLKNRGEFPEWMQNKLANVHDDIRGLHSYMGDHGEDDMKEETIIESHFKHGESVKCKESGMEGEVIDVGNPDEDEKYYTVRREDGEVTKYAPDELESLENMNEAKMPSEKEIQKAVGNVSNKKKAVDIIMKKFKLSKDEAELIVDSIMEVVEEHGAGEEGTDELTAKYKEDTPGEGKKLPKRNERTMTNRKKVDARTRTFKEKLRKLGYKKSVKEDLDAMVNEARRGDSAKDVYWATYSSAISHVLDQAKKKGYEVDEDDVFREITTGQGKPSKGKTVRHTLKLTKNGKPQRKALHIQVYNRGTDKNTFELNFYIS